MGHSVRVEDAVPPAGDRVRLERIRAGDIAEFEGVFREMAPSLRVYIARYVGAREIAEDLVQDLFLTLWRNREALDIHAPIAHYLFTAARNRALNHLKHERVVTRFQRAPMLAAEYAPVADEALLEAELARRIQEAIERLPKRARLIFTMSRQRKMTYQQIAQELDLSVKTIETQMGRALRSIRLYLRDFREEGDSDV